MSKLELINSYRDRHTKYFFLRAEQVSEVFCGVSGDFEFVRADVPTYELGERCPTITFRRM